MSSDQSRILYDVVESGDPNRLAAGVQSRLAEGWLLQGGIAVSAYVETDRDGYQNTTYWYAQAMTKAVAATEEASE